MKLLTSNDWKFRLLRTIIQGVIGVLVANLDLIVGKLVFDPATKTMIVALCMAVLSPIMAEIGQSQERKAEEQFTLDYTNDERERTDAEKKGEAG